MKIIDQSHEILYLSSFPLSQIEKAARTCYKSENKITTHSASVLVKRLIESGHEAMIEFGDITVRFTTNRGVTHELVRHRICNFAQESTRYVKYDGGMEVIRPVWWENSTLEQRTIWHVSMERAELAYQNLLNSGWKAQQAREVLPNSLKTEIVVKANIREWRHIFKLRCAKTAHPQMYELMRPLLTELQEKIPVVFDDITW
ncbi:FAD-dependent thymidylate synthase [Candidatus Pacearchaeota archaeon]|nr:FAD-dependent thymidylate synthase [Candidatus Pacearchaeota archaeon]